MLTYAHLKFSKQFASYLNEFPERRLSPSVNLAFAVFDDVVRSVGFLKSLKKDDLVSQFLGIDLGKELLRRAFLEARQLYCLLDTELLTPEMRIFKLYFRFYRRFSHICAFEVIINAATCRIVHFGVKGRH